MLLNFVRFTILKIWGVLLAERRPMRHVHQVVHQLCLEWQPPGVSLSVKPDVLQTLTVGKVPILLLWLGARHRLSLQCLAIHRHHLLGIKPHLDRELRRLPLVLDKLVLLV